MIAVFVLGISMGALLQYLQDHLVSLGDARRDLEGAALAAEKLRELQRDAEEGILPDSDSGEFEAPYDYLRWEQIVKPETIPLPPEMAGTPPPSTIFAHAGLAGEAGTARPSVVRVEFRVFHEDVEDPDQISPYIIYLVEPPDEADLKGTDSGDENAPAEEQERS
jgi:hypothetical protein